MLDLIIANAAINESIKIPIIGNDEEQDYNCPTVVSKIYHTLT